MNDTTITFQGNVGGDVSIRQAGDAQVANFRVACTPRRYVRKDDAWADEDTQWYTVTAWRALGDHCARSLRRGDPVFVHGRLRAQTWTNSSGIEVTTYEVEALAVGHDLNRGTSAFTRATRAAAAQAAPGDVPAEGAEGEQVTPAPAAA